MHNGQMIWKDGITMTIKITNFRLWRIKKVLVLSCCLSLSLILLFVCKNDKLATLFIILGLLFYDFVVRQPFISDNSSVIHVLPGENEIIVKGLKKEICIKKENITKIETRDVYYGGKWLNVIGKRLIVYTEGKKYKFDFAICDDKELSEKEQNFGDENMQYNQLKIFLERNCSKLA